MDHNKFLNRAIELAEENARSGKGGPFGAIVVKNGKIIAEASNEVTATNDPTAHAEVQAIRAACKKLGSFQLDDCTLYASCEPCPMCLSALYWARPEAVYFAAGRCDAADAGFDDDLIYREIPLPAEKRKLPLKQVKHAHSLKPFAAWKNITTKVKY